MRKLLSIGLLLLALCACASSTGAARNGADPGPRARDQMCVDDCLGAGGNRSFCEDRCTN